MSVSSNLALLGSENGQRRQSHDSRLGSVPDSSSEEHGLDMASPAAAQDGTPSEVQPAETERGQVPHSLKSQQSTISQAANVKGESRLV